MEFNSRFIAIADHTDTVEKARAFIHSVREEMPDAAHHVYAMRVGHRASVIEGMSDDGEPSGSSGPPVLAVVRGCGIGDITVVVTRYFGGTKLGIGGLVRAYSGAAKAVLEVLETEEKVDRVQIVIVTPYGLFEQVRTAIHAYDGVVVDERFAGDITLQAAIPEERLDELSFVLKDLSSGKVVPRLPEESE